MISAKPFKTVDALNEKLKKRLRSIPCSDIQKIMGLLGNWKDVGKRVP